MQAVNSRMQISLLLHFFFNFFSFYSSCLTEALYHTGTRLDFQMGTVIRCGCHTFQSTRTIDPITIQNDGNIIYFCPMSLVLLFLPLFYSHFSVSSILIHNFFCFNISFFFLSTSCYLRYSSFFPEPAILL